MKATINIGKNPESWKKFLFQLMKTNLDVIKRHGLPLLYSAGVKYQPEFMTENWQDAEETYIKGFGDCEDLAAWRAAELQLSGVNAYPDIIHKPTKDNFKNYHAIVRLPNGKIEDPSVLLYKPYRKKIGRKFYGVGNPALCLDEDSDIIQGVLSLPSIITNPRTGKSIPWTTQIYAHGQDRDEVLGTLEDTAKQAMFQGQYPTAYGPYNPYLPGFGYYPSGQLQAFPQATTPQLQQTALSPLSMTPAGLALTAAMDPQVQEAVKKGFKGLKRKFFS